MHRQFAVRHSSTSKMLFYCGIIALCVVRCSAGTALFQCTTIPPSPETFDADKDAEALNAAHEQGTIDVIGYRDVAQRLEISQSLKNKFGEESLTQLLNKLAGHFRDLVGAMLTPKNEFRVGEIHRAIMDPNTDEETFVEILAPLRSTAKFKLSTSYKKRFGQPLEEALKKDKPEDFRKLADFLCGTSREEVKYTDLKLKMVKADAACLLAAGEGKWAAPHSDFHFLFGTRGYGELRKMFQEYEKLAGHSIEDDIRREFQGSLRTGYLEIVKSIRNNDAYLAERLHKALTGNVTDHRTIIRILGVENNLVVQTIKAEYEKLYGHSLQSKINGQVDISGHYKNLLLAVLLCH